MTIDAGAVVAIGVTIGSGIVWLVRLEGRINLSDARWLDIKEQLHSITVKLDGFDQLKNDIGRIRSVMTNERGDR